MNKQTLFKLTALCAGLCFASSAQAWQDYTITDLGSMLAPKINNNGQILMWDMNGQGYLYQRGIITNLNAPNGSYMELVDINNNGQILGYSYPATGLHTGNHPYLYSNGTWTDLEAGTVYTYDMPTALNDNGQFTGRGASEVGEYWFTYSNGVFSRYPSGPEYPHPTAINNSGKIAGYSYDTHGNEHGFLYSNGNITNLGTDFFPRAINDSGQIVGLNYSNGDSFLYSNGSMIDIGNGLDPIDINNSGSVVGQYSISASSHAFLYDLNQGVLLLDSMFPANSGWENSRFVATSINDQGQILVGTYDGVMVRPHSFLFTPIDASGTQGSSPVNPWLPNSSNTSGGHIVNTFDIPTNPSGGYAYIDPLAAIGYEYSVDPTDPAITSVLLPVLGMNSYTLHLLDGSPDITLTGGIGYTFGGSGVRDFQILGIDPSLGLDPNNPTAFVTGLGFASDGTAHVRMTALTDGVNPTVPEPSTLFLFALGGGLLRYFTLARPRSRVGRATALSLPDTSICIG